MERPGAIARWAAAGLGFVVLAATGALWLQGRQRDMADDYTRRVDAQRQDPADAEARAVWNWAGAEAWPALSAVNEACGALDACDQRPGRDRGACASSMLDRCDDAISSLSLVLSHDGIDGTLAYRVDSGAARVCAWRVIAQAAQARPALLEALPPGASSAEAVASSSSEAAAQLDACLVDPTADVGETDRYLRAHFGCCEPRAGACSPACCTIERVALMRAAGVEPMPPDPGCNIAE